MITLININLSMTPQVVEKTQVELDEKESELQQLMTSFQELQFRFTSSEDGLAKEFEELKVLSRLYHFLLLS